MKLEELIEAEESERKKNLERAIQIAKREWENVGTSLKLCGDIGKFDQEDFMIGIIEEDVIIREPALSPTKSVSFYAPTFYPMYFVDNLLIMDEKMPEYNYKTIEALYAYIELATKAAERLGLIGIFSMGFGSGYGNVRTGWIAEKGLPEERKFFFNMFFKGQKVDYNWDFHMNSMCERFKEIFDKFIEWQKNPEIYHDETKSLARVKPMLV